MIVINAHAFNAGYAGAQLAERVEKAGLMCMSERIAVAATAIADWESGKGEYSDKSNHDFLCDGVSKLVSSSMNSDDDALEVLYLAVQKFFIKGGVV